MKRIGLFLLAALVLALYTVLWILSYSFETARRKIGRALSPTPRPYRIMIDAALFLQLAQLNGQVAKAEATRWAALSREQQDRELRVREVEALERQARALETLPRRIHHPFF